MKFRKLVLPAILLSSILAFPDMPRKVSAEEATNHLTDRVAPKYPSIARNSSVQGTVALGIDITETGTVTRVIVFSGHPILIQAAIDAVKNWRYKPFLQQGRPISVHAVVLVPFYTGGTPDTSQIMREAESSDLFQETLRLCRKQVRDQQAEPAEITCKRALSLASKPSVNNDQDRYLVLEQIGNIFFMQQKFSEALENYQQELRLAERDGGINDGAIADARNNVANALSRTDRSAEARRMYEKSEGVYRKMIRSADYAFSKDASLRGLRRVLLDHAAMLRRLGETAPAESLEKEAAVIIVSDRKDD